MAECPNNIEELQELEKLIPLCRVTLYNQAKARIEAGAAKSVSEAARQLADETGRSAATIRDAIIEGGKKQTVDTPQLSTITGTDKHRPILKPEPPATEHPKPIERPLFIADKPEVKPEPTLIPDPIPIVALGEKEILEKAKEIRAEKAKEKKEERIVEIIRQAEEIKTATPRNPIGLFHVISIDPPWPYSGQQIHEDYDPNGRRAANPYPEMLLDDIQNIKIPAADDCVLWLWTTHKFMRHSFQLLDSWGFTDKAILTWVKDRMGLGVWLRSQSEFCIMAVKGKPVINLSNQTTVLNGPMREHSRKPDEFYSMVDALCFGRKLDSFSREKRNGWETYGNDVDKFSR